MAAWAPLDASKKSTSRSEDKAAAAIDFGVDIFIAHAGGESGFDCLSCAFAGVDVRSKTDSSEIQRGETSGEPGNVRDSDVVELFSTFFVCVSLFSLSTPHRPQFSFPSVSPPPPPSPPPSGISLIEFSF